jgi:hypothetical protein
VGSLLRPTRGTHGERPSRSAETASGAYGLLVAGLPSDTRPFVQSSIRTVVLVAETIASIDDRRVMSEDSVGLVSVAFFAASVYATCRAC